ncbi:tRNA 2-thiouridine(34) synthase MnmA [Sinanaerobacter chloroacetimidivorans]|uniref:tRNA-specific 2-thiouridylase MnmA n=1 Tax=Sinanaerobacter chloroacetimidivorans TaxID=2818044 RepID=A0A8J8AZY2_9FIRM|nr:tRNA 2-thiouridine(34) synthase MnmA [Sinanaerobacter chloroacetimidivorans]MBR0596664.1 tRNA 2-thiouridine(34) synthase MnmA [Sinanaerobacter chloroacetimidivorans]
MARVLIAMSGGVDSSVAAVLLMEQGYEVGGATFKLFENEDIGITERTRTCCSLEDVLDAKSVAHKLGFRHDVFNFGLQFQKDVILPFAEAYACGETPNPCIECNRSIKFEKFLERALLLEYDYIATGHYARIEQDSATGRYLLKKGKDGSKDQSYALYTMSQEELSRTLFPLGNLYKTEIREIAEKKGFVNAKKPDSQDICFVKDGDYAGFLEKTIGLKAEEGDFIDKEGTVLGKHKGIIHYTVGQRKGLGKTFGKPMYVTGINAEKKQVFLGSNEELFQDTLVAGNVNFISIPELKEPMEVTVKTRYKQAEVPATIYPREEGTVFVKFKEKQRAITPGQAAVFYQDDIVVGGGKILKEKE